MTVTVNGKEVTITDDRESDADLLTACFGSDWGATLSLFDLKLSEDTFDVQATVSIRPVHSDWSGTNIGHMKDSQSFAPTLAAHDYGPTVYEFQSFLAKNLVTRDYRIARKNGAPRTLARWMAQMECQRLMAITRANDGAAHLWTRFLDTREEFEIDSDNEDEAVNVLNEATEGGCWYQEDGELWLEAFREEDDDE